MESPADAILFFLKSRGSASTLDIAGRQNISRQAARVHLEKLGAEGLVQHRDEQAGVGRPARFWSLTTLGHQRFPDTHAQMTVELIDAVREEFGGEGLERLIARREASTREGYERSLRGAASLEARLATLAKIRAAEGYMAEWQAQDDGTYLLLENHCPVCAAAEACQGFCRSELMLFRALLSPATVERTEHILVGARRCAYLVTP